MMYYRGDTAEERKRKGLCAQCGTRPRTGGCLTCNECRAANLRRAQYTRLKQREAHRKLQASIDAKRQREKREVVINGTTFIVQNS